jgi:hypothetical protein
VAQSAPDGTRDTPTSNTRTRARREDEGSNFDFELSFGEYGLGIGMDDEDDRIGDVQIKHSWFEGSSQNRTKWGSLRQWTS